MIQDIEPRHFQNEYDPKAQPQDDDYALIYEKGELVLKNKEHELLTIGDTKKMFGRITYQYLFRIDEMRFFLVKGADVSGYKTRIKVRDLRDTKPVWLGFAGAVGSQLSYWYAHARFCGVCGRRMEHSTTERAMVCPVCNNTVYPAIAPAVIVAVISGDRILLTKYAHRQYKRYALIAGYTEIGETIEQTVSREVMEEAGIRVKNIRYFGSQPWPFSGTALMGFIAEADGDDTIKMDTQELSVAEWKHRDEIEAEEEPRSLTNTMIQMFRKKLI